MRAQSGNKVITIDTCAGTTNPGVCTMPSEGTPPNVKTNYGLYIVRFRTDQEGYYDVELQAPGSGESANLYHKRGTVHIAE